MADITIALLGVAGLFGLILVGVPIAFALALLGALMFSFVGAGLDTGLALIGSSMYEGVRSYVFVAVPMFILMGAIMTRSRLAADLYDAAYVLLRRLRGSLAIATVYANAMFAAVTGISVASAAIFSGIAFPEMERHGYDRKLSLGCIAGSSVLGMLIPPSVLMILYAVSTQVSIGRLFLGGVLPGIVLALIYTGIILLIGTLRPSAVGRGADPQTAGAPSAVQGGVPRTAAAAVNVPADGPGSTALGMVAESVATVVATPATHPERRNGRVLMKALPIAGLMVVVFGGLWGGLFTPTEASAIGAVGAIGIALLMKLTMRSLLDAFLDSALSTGAVLFLVIGAQAFSRALAASGLVGTVTRGLIETFTSPTVIIVVFLVALVILGLVLDSASIVLLTAPIMFPVISALGVDPIWYGVMAIVTIEIGMLTPPFGVAVFAMSGVLGDRARVEEIFLGTLPFIAGMVTLILLMFAIPGLVTWLPSLVMD